MSATHDQPEIGTRELGGAEFRRSQMTEQVVHAHDRDCEAVGQRLAKGESDQQRADQTRPGSDGDSRKVAGVQARAFEGRINDLRNRTHVVARSQLRHHTTIGTVHIVLTVDHARNDLATTADDRSRHLVARTLDAENNGRGL